MEYGCEGLFTRCWWPGSATGAWMPPWGRYWAGTLQISAAAGAVDPAWSLSRKAGTEHWAGHWRWPRRRPPVGSERSVQTLSPTGGAVGLLGWRWNFFKKSKKSTSCWVRHTGLWADVKLLFKIKLPTKKNHCIYWKSLQVDSSRVVDQLQWCVSSPDGTLQMELKDINQLTQHNTHSLLQLLSGGTTFYMYHYMEVKEHFFPGYAD